MSTSAPRAGSGRASPRASSRRWWPAPWHAAVAGHPTSTHCAHTFFLSVWDRVINGYGYPHNRNYHKSITIWL
ncbi:MAG: hypothetical protein JOZ96_06125 [Acidobacteria bacterium]|nr:hypothetical protein [Acidobacteriota bacterium]MBV9924602.1 hypothetical protein [Acidobacteriota bacterium]